MDDMKFMELAIAQAKIAYSFNEVPVGAVIVKDGIVLAKAYNKKENTKISTKHAEIIAIESACLKLNDWRLDGCTIYTTLEPCMMCMGAIIESRISRLVYGTQKKMNYFPGNNLQTIKYLKKDECLELLQLFFESKR